jgi:acetyl/propionyl-CoA carboxylase alpha subunit
LKINGHAVECRIYAEDPSNNFLPTTGDIVSYSQPSGPGVRVDSGFELGSQITVHYDPLISKLVCWAGNRELAINRMLRALDEYIVGGFISNMSFLKVIINHSSFREGKFDINFLNDDFMSQLSELDDSQKKSESEKAAAILAALLKSKHSMNIQQSNHTEKINCWQEQMYE